jgi:hypothetical protein
MRPLFLAPLLALATPAASAALLVDLDATGLPVGDLAVWDNQVNADPAQDFVRAAGSTAAVAPVGTPAVPAVTLATASDYYVGPEAPAGVTGNGPRTVEVWVYNPVLADEETLVAWGRRGGPDGTNFSFNYGNHATFGAVGYWGPAFDLGWGTPPAAAAWHHLVCAHDGARTRLYANGVLMNDQLRAPNTHYRNPVEALLKIVVGAQNDNAGNPGAIVGTLSLARVRVHDQALTPLQVREQFNADAATFGRSAMSLPPEILQFTVTPPQALPGESVTLSWTVITAESRPLTGLTLNPGVGAVGTLSGSTNVVPSGATTYTLTATNADGVASASARFLSRVQPLVARHRWRFNETGAAGHGFPLADAVGGSSAYVRTNGTLNPFLTGSQVVLPGGTSDTAPYIDLPNGILSTRSGDASFEGWVTLNGSQNWSRIFDFGSSFANGGAEILAPGGAGNGDEYLLLSAQIGGNQTQNRFELRNNGVSHLADVPVPYTAGQPIHFAVVYRGDGAPGGGPMLHYYRNGTLAATVATSHRLQDIRDVNNWLGRSNWMADANLHGSFDEFRVYDGALQPEDVAASFVAGPDVPALPTPLHIDLFGADRHTLVAGESVTLHWAVTAPQGGLILQLQPGALPLTGSSGTVTFSPTTTTTYTLNAVSGGEARASSLTVTVTPIEPTVISASYAVPFAGAVDTALTATDPRGLPLTWSVAVPPAHGTLTGTPPHLTYTAAAGYRGADAFTLRADNGEAFGEGVVSLLVQGGPPLAFPQSVEVPFGRSRALRLTAHDPEGAPLTWSVETLPAHGQLTGLPPDLLYTPAPGYSGPDAFTFRVNDGGLDSAPATVSLTVCPAAAPSGITRSSSALRADDGPGVLLARVRALDTCGETHVFTLVPGDGDTHNAWFAVHGNQLLSAHDFSAAVGQTVTLRLRATDETGLFTEQSFAFTVTAPVRSVVINEILYNTPGTGLRAEFLELYNPGDAPVDLSLWRLADGVEYLFPASTVLAPGGFLVVAEQPAVLQTLFGVAALGPWSGKLSNDGERVQLRDAANQVVDEVDYGIRSPWPTAPNGEGPSLELLDPQLDNDLGGHWRACPLNPAASNLVARGTSWRYRPGVSPASSPELDWTLPGFAEDASWRSGLAPLGLFKVDNNISQAFNAETGVTLGTPLTAAATGLGADMATYAASAVESDANFSLAYRSVFLRREFTLAGDPPAALRLRVMRHDAAIVWINGVEVARFGFAPDAPAVPPPDHTGLYEHGNDPWSETVLTDLAGVLTPGVNVLAVQGWAKSPRLRGGPNGQDTAVDYNVFDFCVDAELTTMAEVRATPGAPNAALAANPAPAVRGVSHAPARPLAGQPITVTARVSDRQGLAGVSLQYQVVAPGAYLPAELPRTNAEILADPRAPRPPNPAYHDPANWTTVPMSDGGDIPGDTAGDGTFTGVIPPQAHRSLVRYRFLAEDLAGATAQVPAPDDATRNYACFVYNGVPAYVNGAVTVLPADLESLPVYHWLMRPADWDRLLAYTGPEQFPNNKDLNVLLARRYENFLGALVVDGEVYDHVEIRLRGGNSRYTGTGKRHFRFVFPRGRPLLARDEKGRAYPRPWEDMLFNKLFGNNGPYDWGLVYRTGAKLWSLQGLPMPGHHYVHFRVVRGADEAHPTQGDFYGLYQALEFPDGKNFLAARNLPEGNFYKLSDWIQNGEMDERHLVADGPRHAEDYDHIRYNIHPATPGADLARDVNLPLYYRYNAVQEAIRHYDLFIEPTGRHRMKNLYWYFHPGPLHPDGSRVNPFGQCWFLPYDWDASFGPNYNNGYDNVINALYNLNAIPDSPTWGAGSVATREAERIARRNAIREFRDLVFHRDAFGGGPVDSILDDGLATLSRFWPADQSRWAGITGATVADLPGGPAGKANDMRAFCFTGWTGANGPAVGAGGRAAHLDAISDALDIGQLPGTPLIAYAGTAGHPVDGLRFTATPFTHPQGPSRFAAIQWRAGEVTDPAAPAFDPDADRLYEAVAVWESGPLPLDGGEVLLPPNALRNGHAYRVRARYVDTTGRAGHWSAPVAFIAGEANTLASLQEALILQEVMYKPAPATPAELGQGWIENDFEYIELKNRSTQLTLSLDGVRFTKGVDFDFPPGLTLAPRERMLVVRNLAAFTSRYGAGHPVAGEWQSGQSLSNGGEQLKLSFGAGEAIHDLEYLPTAPWPVGAAAGGVPMLYVGPAPVYGQPDPQADGAHWVAGQIPGGTPGGEEYRRLSEWLADRGETDPGAPSGIGTWDNLSAFALARDLGAPPLWGEIAWLPDETLPTFRYTRRRGALDVVFTEELASALLPSDWASAGLLLQQVQGHPDGTETRTFQIQAPVGSGSRGYVRVRVETVGP